MMTIVLSLWKYLQSVLSSRYKWLLLIFFLWSYRVGYMPNSDGGFARVLQVGCLAAMAFLFNQYKNGIFSFTLNRTNAAIKSIYWLYIYATISALWSIMPFFSAFLAIQNIVLIVGLTWLFTRSQTFLGIERTFIYFTLSLIFFDGMCRRIFIEPGALFTHHLTNGSTSAMLISYCFAEIWGMHRIDPIRKKLLKGTLLIALFFLVTATSSGANASAIFGVGVAAVLSGMTLLYSLLFLLFLGLIIFRDNIDQLLLLIMPGKTMETVESATGRARLWDIMMELAAQKPWFGWGYACIERAATLTGKIESPDAHNNYLGLYGSLGYIGSAIAYISFAISLFSAWKKRLKPGMKGIIAAMCCALLNGYSYGYLAGKACNITVVFFALIVLIYSYSKVKYYDKLQSE